jgi:hypothetical protein
MLFLMVLSGCASVPGGSSVKSEKVIGERRDGTGRVVATIVRREMMHDVGVLLGPEGPGNHPIRYLQYRLVTGEKVVTLAHIYSIFDPSIYEIDDPVLPVDGTNSWIASRVYEMEANSVGIELILFDQSRVIQKMRIDGCLRGGEYSGSAFPTFAIDANKGNKRITIHSKNGDFYFDTVTGDHGKQKSI